VFNWKDLHHLFATTDKNLSPVTDFRARAKEYYLNHEVLQPSYLRVKLIEQCMYTKQGGITNNLFKYTDSTTYLANLSFVKTWEFGDGIITTKTT
jgi:hypothetical protein